MEYEIDESKGKLGFKYLGLMVSASLMALFALLIPFAVHSSKLVPILAFGSVDGSKPGCIANGNYVAYNQCAVWTAPHSLWPITWMLLGLIVASGIALNQYALRLAYRNGVKFANYRMACVILTSLIGLGLYSAVRDFSQNHVTYNFGFVSSKLATGATLTSGTAYPPFVPIHPVVFGFGLTSAMAILLLLGFALPAYISWHSFNFGKRYVGGQKTNKLFR